MPDIIIPGFVYNFLGIIVFISLLPVIYFIIFLICVIGINRKLGKISFLLDEKNKNLNVFFSNYFSNKEKKSFKNYKI